MKSTQSIGNYQAQPGALRLFIPPNPEGIFDPDWDALDFLTSEVLAEVIRNDWKPPFELQFLDADQVLLGERCVTIRNDSIMQETISRGCGYARVPLICKLVDSLGQTHERVLSEEETRKWVSGPSYEGTYLDDSGFKIVLRPGGLRNFSARVYIAVMELVLISAAKEFEPPLTVEIRDAEGQLFQAQEVSVNDEDYLQVPKVIADCAHLPFPITVKLISQTGAELTKTVQRQQ